VSDERSVDEREVEPKDWTKVERMIKKRKTLKHEEGADQAVRSLQSAGTPR
jgi:hypothetical protein